MQAIILAGGKGTRLREAVPDVPKPLAPIRGRPFLEHQMEYWVRQGVDRFMLSVGYKAEMIIDRIGPVFGGVPVDYSVEKVPLGTGGGLLKAIGQLQPTSPYLVMNGDTFVDVKLDELTAFSTARGADFTFTLFRTDDAARYLGMDVAPDGRIVSLNPVSEGPRLANGGVYLVRSGLLDAGGGDRVVSLETELIPGLFAAGTRLYGMAHLGRFIDIGIPADFHRAAEIL